MGDVRPGQLCFGDHDDVLWAIRVVVCVGPTVLNRLLILVFAVLLALFFSVLAPVHVGLGQKCCVHVSRNGAIVKR